MSDAENPVLAGQGVDHHLGAGCPVGEVEERAARGARPVPGNPGRLVVASLREVHPRLNATLGEIGEGEALVAGEDAVVAECDLLRGRPERLGGDRRHAALDGAGGEARPPCR